MSLFIASSIDKIVYLIPLSHYPTEGSLVMFENESCSLCYSCGYNTGMDPGPSKRGHIIVGIVSFDSLYLGGE